MADDGWFVTLNNGKTIPGVGIGTWLSKPGEVGRAIDVAIRAGYRHIDGAYLYSNEKEIGDALQILYKEGVVRREDLFITSKLSSFHMTSKQDVHECCQAVLKNLQTDYLDLFLVHSPIGIRKGADFTKLAEEDIYPYNEATIATLWEGMEELVQLNLVQSIGISNFTITKIERLLKMAKIVPVVNQVEYHAYFQQTKLRAYCKSKGIELQAFGPLGSPGRSANIDPNDPVVLEDPLIKEIATKHNATPAQICISFLLHLGLIVLPKSVTESRIIENYESTQVKLTDEELTKLKGIDKNFRLLKLRIFNIPQDDLWDVEDDKHFNSD